MEPFENLRLVAAGMLGCDRDELSLLLDRLQLPKLVALELKSVIEDREEMLVGTPPWLLLLKLLPV